jgi:ribosome maturation factor RimP
MLTKSGIVELLTNMAAQHGLRVYDIDLPRGNRGILRVFVSKSSMVLSESSLEQKYITQQDATEVPRLGQVSQISHDDCSALSRTILSSERVEELLPGDCQLEVSSPGINRRLVTLEHFEEAIGERVQVKTKGGLEEGKGASFLGTLVEVLEGNLGIEVVGKSEPMIVKFAQVKSAHVDFPFDETGRSEKSV